MQRHFFRSYIVRKRIVGFMSCLVLTFLDVPDIWLWEIMVPSDFYYAILNFRFLCVNAVLYEIGSQTRPRNNFISATFVN